MDSTLSLDGTAAQLGISPSYLSRIFSEVDESALPSNSATCASSRRSACSRGRASWQRDVGQEVGFLTVQNFMQVFKSKTGVTPVSTAQPCPERAERYVDRNPPRSKGVTHGTAETILPGTFTRTRRGIWPPEQYVLTVCPGTARISCSGRTTMPSSSVSTEHRREINEQFVRENGVRGCGVSGGGAVYHDMGNLNFTFIADAGDMGPSTSACSAARWSPRWRRSASPPGITACNDMTIDGQKFSGNSSTEGRVMPTYRSCSTPELDLVAQALPWIRKIRAGVSPPCAAASPPCAAIWPVPSHSRSSRSLLLREILGSPATSTSSPRRDKAQIAQLRAERYATWEELW